VTVPTNHVNEKEEKNISVHIEIGKTWILSIQWLGQCKIVHKTKKRVPMSK